MITYNRQINNLADSHYRSDVRIAVCRGKTCVRMFRHGIVHDAVLHHQSNLFNNTWFQLRQKYPSDVESSVSVRYRFSCRYMAVL